MAKKKILLVDDEEELVDMVRMRLEAAGYDVLSAADGQAGLDAARRERPDLIVLDVMLPKMDGYEVCAELKKDGRCSSIPVLFFTAKAQEEDMKLGREAGGDGYLTKPFDPQAFISKIRKMLKE